MHLKKKYQPVFSKLFIVKYFHLPFPPSRLQEIIMYVDHCEFLNNHFLVVFSFVCFCFQLKRKCYMIISWNRHRLSFNKFLLSTVDSALVIQRHYTTTNEKKCHWLCCNGIEIVMLSFLCFLLPPSFTVGYLRVCILGVG